MDIKLLALLVLLSFSLQLNAQPSPPHFHHFRLKNATDQDALLEFKVGITNDPNNSLHNWNPSILPLCNWRGVACSSRRQRVTALNLTGMGLQGSISPFLGNLSFLRLLDLSYNTFHGQIPYQLGNLFRLRKLRLDNNEMEGTIPSSMAACGHLQLLFLSFNHLTGSIPSELSLLTNLEVLRLGYNNLTGTIPAFLANISSLVELKLSGNILHGHIPHDLGLLTQLKVITLAGNQLTGQIPTSISKLASLEELYLWGNQLSGRIPNSLYNCTQLQILQLSQNQLSGIVPMELATLPRLQWLSLFSNQLVSGSTTTLPILTALTNCSLLQHIALHDNHLTGTLPSSIGQLSNKLTYLSLGTNLIGGKLPQQIGNLTNLTVLSLEVNLFIGPIPSALCTLEQLQILYMGGNKFEGSIPTEIGQLTSLGLLSLDQTTLSGQIPHSLGHLPQLRRLYLDGNQLSGNIPASLGDCRTLELLDLSYNRLTGNIPLQVAALPNLAFYFNLSNNLLQGALPLGINKMMMVQAIDISANRLTGVIPSTLGSCIALEYLDLSWNTLEGPIPVSLGELQNLQAMDFFSNKLSGTIPTSLEKLKLLRQLNFSNNNLTGQVPRRGIFTNLSAAALKPGNPGLCGQWIAGLPECPALISHKHSSLPRKVIFPVVGIIAFLIICCLLVGFLWRRNRMRHSIKKILSIKVGPRVITYDELMTATQGFHEANLVGVGSFGRVYKGILNDGTLVVVKVLNMQNEEARMMFNTECKVLRRVRHRNVIKIITSCSNLDFTALVLPFMANGSLDKCLYSDGDECGLNLTQRLKIAVDIAQGMAFLHHHNFVQVVHCDLKPSNVLLDEEMAGRVADFGIARLTCGNSMDSFTSSLALGGSVGYIAPEYGMGGRPSTKGDVYSYGVLLLELLTRRRPTDDMFVEGLNVQKWVTGHFPNRMAEVVDNNLLSVSVESEDSRSRVIKCASELIRVGLACTQDSPRERPTMGDVVERMEIIRAEFSGNPVRASAFGWDISALSASTSAVGSLEVGQSESQASSTL
eukprot:Gb_28309 [translate_table: standard]